VRYCFNAFNASTFYGGPPDLPGQIAAAAAAGYDAVGLDLFSVHAHERAGLPVAAIGDALERHGIATDTVRNHIRQIYSTLQVHNVAEAVSYALRHGLV